MSWWLIVLLAWLGGSLIFYVGFRFGRSVGIIIASSSPEEAEEAKRRN